MGNNTFTLTCRHCGARYSSSTDSDPRELITFHSCQNDQWFIGAPAILTWDQEPPHFFDSPS